MCSNALQVVTFGMQQPAAGKIQDTFPGGANAGNLQRAHFSGHAQELQHLPEGEFVNLAAQFKCASHVAPERSGHVLAFDKERYRRQGTVSPFLTVSGLRGMWCAMCGLWKHFRSAAMARQGSAIRAEMGGRSG